MRSACKEILYFYNTAKMFILQKHPSLDYILSQFNFVPTFTINLSKILFKLTLSLTPRKSSIAIDNTNLRKEVK
jgi:uncharacterized membrane protein